MAIAKISKAAMLLCVDTLLHHLLQNPLAGRRYYHALATKYVGVTG